MNLKILFGRGGGHSMETSQSLVLTPAPVTETSPEPSISPEPDTET